MLETIIKCRKSAEHGFVGKYSLLGKQKVLGSNSDGTARQFPTWLSKYYLGER